MVSLSYRSFANFIVEDNLVGLRCFLENRHVVVDDRDEVSYTIWLYIQCPISILMLYSTLRVALFGFILFYL